MSTTKLSDELQWRGFVNQTTFKDLKALDAKKFVFYCGYDASADSLTIGNLATVMFNRAFIRHGHKAIVLAGGATSLIGDPGGKDIERPLQDAKSVEANVTKVTKQVKQLLGQEALVVNNLDWFKSMPVIEFLRDVGKHFSMTPLIQRDYIASRIGKDGSGISYTEFSYTLLQGYDYLHLHNKYGVNLQLAGSDQWGNCLSGVELVRKATSDEVDALTMPLIIDSSTGKKFGKSEAGAIWLDSAKTSVNDFYQFWINTPDESVSNNLKIFTELDQDEVAKIMIDFEKEKPARLAQKALAYEVTKFVHSETAANDARDHAHNLSSSATSSAGFISEGDEIAETLVKYGLAVSNSEARKLLLQGGIYINNVKITRPNFSEEDFKNDRLILRRGKALRNTVVLKRH